MDAVRKSLYVCLLLAYYILYCILFGLSTLSGAGRFFVYTYVLPEFLQLLRNKRHVDVSAHTGVLLLNIE